MGHTQGIGSLVAKPAEGMQIFFFFLNGGGSADRNWSWGYEEDSFVLFFSPPKLFLTSIMAVLKIKKVSELSVTSF